jgi:CNT family concentrative nucleoside transporter
LSATVPDAAGHFIIASVLGAPAAILFGQIMVPDSGTSGYGAPDIPPVATSTMDAIVKGTMAGLELLLSIIAMLIVFIALVHLANTILAVLPPVGGVPVTLQRALGAIMQPLCWLIGVPWAEAATAGALMGTKTVINEFVAYVEMSKLSVDALSERSRLIMLYALCGFANFGSLGIMIGGLLTMAPERRTDILALGTKSLVSGTLSTLLLGAVVGALS